ncbi:phage major capsid protein [Glutamicibacter sp.]|jgi:hypothetical protein|uniref:phage major capsid protein n=1 Tax=Glutamicibacter sp. TaxID=1931995 RepID=UPI002FD9D446
MALPYLDWLASITHRFIRNVVTDNFFTARPIQARLRKNRLRYPGGLEATIAIIKGSEPNTKAFAGADLLTLELAEPFNAAKYTMKRYVTQLVIPKEDILKNSGPAQVVSLVTARRRNSELSLFDLIGTDFTSTSTGAGADVKKVEGLQNIVDSSTVSGGIDPADLSTWAAFETASAQTIVTNMKAIQSLYGAVTFGADQPTIAFTTQTILDQMWERSTNVQRFVDESLAAIGFTHLGFNQRPVVVDPGVPASNFWWINEKYLWLYIHQQDDFDTVFIPVMPDQDVSVWRITTSMMLLTDCRRMHAKHTNLAVV